MEAHEALTFFANHKKISGPLRTIVEVGLGYLQLGQAANTFSGGEAQRIKLVPALARPQRQLTIFLLDEPTTGCISTTCASWSRSCKKLVARGETVVVIDHHPVTRPATGCGLRMPVRSRIRSWSRQGLAARGRYRRSARHEHPRFAPAREMLRPRPLQPPQPGCQMGALVRAGPLGARLQTPLSGSGAPSPAVGAGDRTRSRRR